MPYPTLVGSIGSVGLVRFCSVGLSIEVGKLHVEWNRIVLSE